MIWPSQVVRNVPYDLIQPSGEKCSWSSFNWWANKWKLEDLGLPFTRKKIKCKTAERLVSLSHTCELSIKNIYMETSLAVQWLRFCTSNAGDMGSIPGPGTKISHAVWPNNNNNFKNKKWIKVYAKRSLCKKKKKWKVYSAPTTCQGQSWARSK